MIPIRRKTVVVLAWSLLFLTGIFLLAPAPGKGADAPKMTKEELLSFLGNPDVTILDVRVGGEWQGSKEKIKGAVREDPEQVKTWAAKYSKDKTLVLYCS